MAAASSIASARRSTELSLVVMAALITAGGYTLASLGSFARIPTRIVPFLAVLLGMLIVAHLAVRWFAQGADATMLPLAALLHGIGYVMITRLDERLAGLQATWSIVAIAVFVATLVVVQRAADLARYRWTFLAIGIGLLVLPMVPGVGYSAGGARIWVTLRLPRRDTRADRRRDVEGRPAAPARAAPPAPDRVRLGVRRASDGGRT